MAQTAINIKDLASDGVTLTPSTSPDFNARVTALIGIPSATAASLLPYSVVLTNSSTRTVRGYALRWKGFDKQGNPTYSDLQIEQNFDTRTKGVELLPGGSRALSPLAPLDNLPPVKGPRPIANMDKLVAQASLTVTLDSVAFDDGKVIGPNEGFAINVWSQMYAAQRDMALSVLNKQAQGTSPADIVTWLQQQSTVAESHPAGTSPQESLTGASHWYQVYARMTANTLMQAGRKSPDGLVAKAQRLAQTPVPSLSR